jgi:tetratricopeptide (TPR) repeat protein
MNMQTEKEKSALIEVRSLKRKPQTDMEVLRDLLATIEKRIAKLKEISSADALEILPMLDQARERLDAIESAGGSAGSEGTQFESLLMQLDKKEAVFVNRVGGAAALQQARAALPPDGVNQWWFIDQSVAQKRQSTIKRWTIGAGIIAVILIALTIAYNQFLAPDPVFQAGIGFQQTAENKLILGEYQDALVDVNQAIHNLPDYPELFLLRGVIYELLEQPDLAEESFNQARAMLGENEVFFSVRGKYFLMAGLSEQGMLDAEMALSINPDSAVSLMYMGQAYEMQGDLSKAIDYYELASAAAERANNPTLQVMARMQVATLMQQLNIPVLETPEE